MKFRLVGLPKPLVLTFCTVLITGWFVAFGGPEIASAEMATSVGVVSFSDSPDPVRVGEDLTYTYVVRNSGLTPATDVAVHTGVHSSVVFISSEFSSGGRIGTCPPDEQGHITCHVGNLGTGEEATLRV